MNNSFEVSQSNLSSLISQIKKFSELIVEKQAHIIENVYYTVDAINDMCNNLEKECQNNYDENVKIHYFNIYKLLLQLKKAVNIFPTNMKKQEIVDLIDNYIEDFKKSFSSVHNELVDYIKDLQSQGLELQ